MSGVYLFIHSPTSTLVLLQPEIPILVFKMIVDLNGFAAVSLPSLFRYMLWLQMLTQSYATIFKIILYSSDALLDFAGALLLSKKYCMYLLLRKVTKTEALAQNTTEAARVFYF